MRRTTLLLGAAAALAATTAFASAAGAHATGANAVGAPAIPGWRIVASYPGWSSVSDLAAAGPDSVWATEDCVKPCPGSDGVILRHWDGKAWQVQPQPAALAGYSGSTTFAIAVAPGSRTPWAVYDPEDRTSRPSAAEWTGKSWAAPKVFAAGTAFTPVALGPSGAWLLGWKGADLETPYAVRYNGTSWRTAPLPGGGLGFTAVTGGAHGEIWAEDIASSTNSLAVSHWNGERWVAQPVPGMPGDADGASVAPGAIAASGPSNVWGYGYSGTSAGGVGLYWLVHWNGGKWSTVKVPYRLSAGPGGGPATLGSDGRGGAWFAATAYGTSREYLYHVSAAGHWLDLPLPALKGGGATDIYGFAAVPGTSSVYAYGASVSPGTSRAVIAEYRQP